MILRLAFGSLMNYCNFCRKCRRKSTFKVFHPFKTRNSLFGQLQIYSDGYLVLESTSTLFYFAGHTTVRGDGVFRSKFDLTKFAKQTAQNVHLMHCIVNSCIRRVSAKHSVCCAHHATTRCNHRSCSDTDCDN